MRYKTKKVLPDLAGFLRPENRVSLRHSLEPNLLLGLFVTVLAVRLAERALRACAVQLDAAAHALDCWGGERFSTDKTIRHAITKQTYVELTDKR